MFLANVFLKLNKANEAVQQLQPYIQVSLASPDEHVAIIIPYVEALADLDGAWMTPPISSKPFLSSPRWALKVDYHSRFGLPEKEANVWFNTVEPLISTLL